MKNVTTHKGTLDILTRLPSSASGNPRWLLRLDGWTCRTLVDSCEAYGITNLDGKQVTAELGTHYGTCHAQNIREAK